MAKANRLQDTVVKALKYDVPDSAGVDKEWRNDGNGLYIRVRPNGKKSWVLRRKIKAIDKDGKPCSKTKKTTVGHYPELSLKNARLQAGQVRIEDEKTASRSLPGINLPGTFGELLERFYDEQIESIHKDPRQIRLYLDNRVPNSIKALMTADLDSNATRNFRIIVGDWLYSCVSSRGPTAANKLLAIFKQATKWATGKGYLTVDPLRELTKKLVGGTEKPRTRKLSNVEIKSFWFAESSCVPLLQFLLLTGQRIGEAQAANWADIQDGRWHIPAEIAKNGRAHWVPITGPIKDILNTLPSDRKKIFATRSTRRVQEWLKHWCARENIDPGFTPHDFRRTYITELNEINDVEPYVVEKLVNHSLRGVMAVYNHAEYAEQRIAAAEKWSEHVISIVEDQPVSD